MLSSLASYLLGGGAAAAAETHSPAEALVPPAAVDADDGWVLVDSVEGSCADSTFVDLRLTMSAVTTAAPTTGTTGQASLSNAGVRGRRRGSRVEPRPPTPAATPEEGGNSNESESAAFSETGTGGDAGATTPAGLRSRSSSSASLPCLLVDESWYVTPPPCFTSTGPVHMETSPLEDLLIEHPSMSVYHQHPRAAPGPIPAVSAPLPPPSPAAAGAPAAAEAARPRAGSLPPPLPVPVPVAPPAARGAGVLRLQEQQGLQLKTAQKVQQRRATQALKRGPLGRQNKARECNGRNKVLRRSDRMLQHSGANNNRKC